MPTRKPAPKPSILPLICATNALLLGIAIAIPASANDLIGANHCIAHAGATDHAPENTMAGFRLALAAGADFIEPDLQLTRDGVLVCLHDKSLERTTNVEDVFPERARSVVSDGQTISTWLVNDFTLAEIRRLDAGSWYDASFKSETVPTFQELIDLARGKAGLYPETKDPDFYLERGTDIDLALHRLLVENGLDSLESQRTTPILIQSFHRNSLEKLKQLGGSTYPLIQLVGMAQYNDYLSDDGLTQVATYAQGVSPVLSFALADRTLLARAHDHGLALHAWVIFEDFSPREFESEKAYIEYLLAEKLDGLFVHAPELCP
jgi:glycerophosphoryl diester phosphodiesterase